jgi:hypothetical protein
MSDIITNTLPPPSTNVDGGSDLSPGQIASARVAWIGRGLDAAAFDAAINGTPPPSQPVAPSPGPGTVALTPTGVEVNLTGEVRMSAAQAEQIADALAKAGVSAERIAAALKADGFELAPGAGEELSPEETAALEAQQEWDREHGFGTEYAAADYRLDFSQAIRASNNPIHPDQLASINSAASDFMSALQINPGLASSLVSEAMATGQAFNRMSPAEQALQKQSVAVAIDPETARLIEVALGQAEGSEFVSVMRAAAQRSVWIAKSLANHAANLEHYWGGKAGR